MQCGRGMEGSGASTNALHAPLSCTRREQVDDATLIDLANKIQSDKRAPTWCLPKHAPVNQVSSSALVGSQA